MARRPRPSYTPASDQRQLLVELELDDGFFPDARPGAGHVSQSLVSMSGLGLSFTAPTPANVQSSVSRARPQSAKERGSPDSAHRQKLQSPYKLKQRVISSRPQHSQSETPCAGFMEHPSSLDTPLILIADAIRQNVGRRNQTLMDLQAELDRPTVKQTTCLLSNRSIKLLNRFRSLTLSVIEMVRYFHEQPRTQIDQATYWMLDHECRTILLRFAASDADCLGAFPSYVRSLEALGVSVLRNPLVDGVSIDSSELLLCSCQASNDSMRSTITTSSVYQLVLGRLEAFAAQVRQIYPSWQVLPHERVARALLELLELDNTANATRLLPSYLQPEPRQARPTMVPTIRERSQADSRHTDVTTVPLNGTNPRREPTPTRHTAPAAWTDPSIADNLSARPSTQEIIAPPVIEDTFSASRVKPREITPRVIEKGSNPTPVESPKTTPRVDENAGASTSQKMTPRIIERSQVAPQNTTPRGTEEAASINACTPRKTTPRELVGSTHTSPGCSRKVTPREFEEDSHTSPVGPRQATHRALEQSRQICPAESKKVTPRMLDVSPDVTPRIITPRFTQCNGSLSPTTSQKAVPRNISDTSSSSLAPSPVPPSHATPQVIEDAFRSPVPSCEATPRVFELVGSSTPRKMTPRTIEPISSSPRDASPRIEQRLPEAVNTSIDNAEPKSSTSSPLYDAKPSKKSKRVMERAYTLSTLDHIPRASELPVITFPSEAKAYQANVVPKSRNGMADELEEPEYPRAGSIELDDTSIPLAQTKSPCLTELVVSDAPSERAEPENSSIAEVDDDTDDLAFDGERVRAAIASALDILPLRFFTFSHEDEKEERELVVMEHKTDEVLHANEDVLAESELANEEVDIASEKEELRTGDGEIVNDQTDSRPSTGFTQDDFFPSRWATRGIILDDESMDIERELVLEQLELLDVHTNDEESSSLDHYRLPTEQSDVDDPPIFEIFTNTPRSEPPEPGLEVSTARKPDLLETEALSTDLARILALCRDVQLTTVEMTQRLDLEVARSSSPLPTPFVAPHLSTRYLERELKTLRRYFHNWHTVCLEKQHRLACLRDSWAIRRITCAMWNWRQQKQQKRAAERQQQLVRAACCIQRSWRAALARRRCRVRQQLFHELHRAFKRVHFFTRLCQRHKYRIEAQLKLQRWWKRVLRRKRAREYMLAKARADEKRRATAAKQLHTFVTQQHLRHKLAQALETNRRLAFKQQLQITKARSEEEKRRQLESKRRTELQVVIKQALHEMERKWLEAEAEKTRLLAEQAEKERISREMEAQRQRRQAKETIQAFLTLQILRKRLVDANRAKEETLRKQQAEERAHRKQLAADRAQQLLATRMLHWQLTRQQTQAERERRRWHEEQQIQAKKTAAHVIRQFVTLRVSEYCAKAEQTTLVSKQKILLKAKERELLRIKHSSARERINAWLSRCVHDRKLEAAAREACEAAVRQQQALAAERRRCESEQRIQHWLVSQLQRQQARQAQAVTKQKRQEVQRLERERQEAAREDERAKTLMHHEHAIEQLQRKMEEERERIVALERRLQMYLVERLVANKLMAEQLTSAAFACAVKTFHSEQKRLETAVKAKQLRIRSIERRGWYKWRQWFIGRQARTEITKEALWPTRDAQAPLISTATTEELESETRRSLRLFELRCIASARKLQRCWRSWQRRLRQRRRQSVKRREDELVHEHKARKPTVSAPIIDDRLEDAAWLLQDWWQHVWERRELWYTVTIENSIRLTLYFKAGRAWLTEGGRRFSEAVRLQFDRSVTRKLLEIVTSSAHSREDVLSAMEDIAFDSAPLLTTARGSPRTQQLVNGASFLPVDELELPHFCSRTRQMTKARSMHKRQQLLDAKAATGNNASVASMTIFDAVETASVDDASFLLQQGVNLHRLEAHTHRTALHALAFCTECLQMRLGMLDFLLERAKININARDAHGDTALTLFAARGHAAMIQHMLQRSSAVDWRALNQDGRNALHCACEQDQIEVAVLLQQLFALDPKKHKAHGEVVAPTQTALLLELHRPDSSGRTPLHVLAEHGHIDCLRSILSALSSELRELLISRADPLGRTPVLTAIRHSHVEFVTTLLEFSASVLARDSRLRSVLHYAVDAVDAIAMTTLLVENRADLQSVDERGDSVLHYAAITGRVAVVRHLLTLGADPRVLNSDHESPAQVAVLHGHMECARLLLVVSTEEDKVLRGLRLDSPSAKSYCFPVASAAAPREKTGYWEELHQDVELVEESGHFSSEDEGETSKGWDSD